MDIRTADLREDLIGILFDSKHLADLICTEAIDVNTVFLKERISGVIKVVPAFFIHRQICAFDTEDSCICILVQYLSVQITVQKHLILSGLETGAESRVETETHNGFPFLIHHSIREFILSLDLKSQIQSRIITIYLRQSHGSSVLCCRDTILRFACIFAACFHSICLLTGVIHIFCLRITRFLCVFCFRISCGFRVFIEIS